MQNFQDTFETRKRLFINAFSVSMTVPFSLIICSKLLVQTKLTLRDYVKTNMKILCIKVTTIVRLIQMQII